MKALLLQAADFALGLAAIPFLAVFLAGCGDVTDLFWARVGLVCSIAAIILSLLSLFWKGP